MPVTFDSDSITPEYLEKFYRGAVNPPWRDQDEVYFSDPGNMFRFALLAEELERIAPSRILDVGCGGMPLAAFASKKLSAEYVGCDIAQPERMPADALFAVADAAKLSFSDSSFESVVCSETLEHLYDPAPAIKEIARVLSSDGGALLTVPNWFSLDSLDGAAGIVSAPLRAAAGVGLAPEFKHGINVHITRAAPRVWRKLIEENGLRVESEKPIYLFPYIPYFLNGAKKLESRFFKNKRTFDFWRSAENSLARIYPLSRLGQFHFFLCRKKS
ncbi:MAG: class I SAM-dependent methyltransferase [bacterium]